MGNEIVLELGKQHQLKYENSSLFQQDGYRKIAGFLRETKNKFDAIDKDRIANCRFHDTILIEGARGSGKSVFLYNLDNPHAFSEEDRRILNNFKFLDTIDPTLLSGTKDFISCEAFCSILVGLIHECVMQEKDPNSDLKKYFKCFKQVADSLASLRNAREEEGIDAIYANQSALKLEQNLHAYLQCVSRDLYDEKQLVLRIDDVDMAFANGFHVLETVRKYLASPYILPIVSGDSRLYQQLVQMPFQEALKIPESKSDETSPSSKKISPKELSEKYLVKVLPFDRQLRLSTLPELLRKYKFRFKVKNQEYDLVKIQQRLDDLFNHGIQQTVYRDTTLDFSKDEDPTESKENISRDSLRLWIQFHGKMSPVYQKWQPYMATDEWFNLYRDFQQRIYDFFNPLNTFDRVAAFSAINLAATGETEGNRFDYRIALKQLAYMPNRKISCEGEDEYKKTKKLLSMPLSSLNEDGKADRATKTLEGFEPQERLLLQLFVSNNYYTISHRKPWLLFAGRFVEFVFATIDLKYQENGEFNWNKSFNGNEKILYATPVFSLLEKEKRLDNLLPATEETELDAEDSKLLEDASLENVLKNWEELKKLEELKKANQPDSNNPSKMKNSKEIQAAEAENSEEEKTTRPNASILFVDAHFLHEVLNRFFSNLEVLRMDYNLNKGEALYHYMLRCAYMLLNAVGTCETKGRVALQNIALMEAISNDKIKQKDNCYNKNIAPLLNQNTLTAQLYRHPVIDMILQMGDGKYEGNLNLPLGTGQPFNPSSRKKTVKEQILSSTNMQDLLQILKRWKDEKINEFNLAAQDWGPLTSLGRALKKHLPAASEEEKRTLLELTGCPEEKLTQFRM